MLESNISNNLVYKRKQYYDYALAILALLMPLVVKGFPVLIVISAIIGILYFFRAYQKLGKPKKDYYLLPYNLLKDGLIKIFKDKGVPMVMVILFLYFLVSLFYSEDTSNSYQKIILKSCYLYFPLIFALTKWDRKKLLRVLDFYIIGCFLQVIISLVDAFVDAGYKFDLAHFTYIELSYNLHPGYASLLLNFGIVFNLSFLISKVKDTWINYYLRLPLTLLFAGFVLMLSSKIATISLGVIIFVAFIAFLTKQKISLQKIGLSLVIISILGGVVYLNKSQFYDNTNELTKAIKVETENRSRDKSASMRSTGIRMVLWESSISTFLKSPVIGFGIGDGKNELQKTLEYNEEVFVRSLDYNCHNQFMETGLMLGGIGVAVLVSLLFLSLWGFGGFSWWSSAIVFSIFASLMVESMMEKQTGSIPIVWMLCLLFSAKPIFKSIFSKIPS